MAPSRGDGDGASTPLDLSYPSRLVQTLDSHSGPVNVIKYNHGAKYLLSGSSDRSIRLWNPSLGKEIKFYNGHAQEVLALDITHDNAKFASSGGDRAVFLWDVPTGSVIRRMQGHFGKINAVGFSPDSQILASAGFDAKVMLWDMRASSRDPLQTLKEASSTVSSLLLPSSPQIITGSYDGHLRTYDLRFGLLTEDVIGEPISSIRLSRSNPEESILVGTTPISSDAPKIRIFDRKDGSCLQTVKGHDTAGSNRWAMEWGYGEGYVLAGDRDGKMWGWNVLDAKPLPSHPKQIHKKQITSLVINPRGKEMISASADGTIKVWHK
uniref:Mitogen-activated protein kinase organizer 1 n=1 Tax=Kwoniella bestiolae CBS 10118 TaxID=1296100 RepID=A0A1B9GC06_9TREE|nr:mitogen-activated protein kinase organizer 1 [Kwoniella bestiolae CBS 10118]OCF28556.1 mitogen-activated protein kinase organizer 1 [Kwoniella bestiolae CBS 10118]